MTDKIFHIADVHIRTLRRHDEYIAVFDRLYKYIKKNSTKNSVILLAGDIVHQKTDISPEMVNLTGTFIKSLSDITNVIIITGNHDLNLNNFDRMDSLTPIVNNLNKANIHYFKTSGVYKINDFDNVSYSVFSLLDNERDWVTSDKMNTNDIKIALYHGIINGAISNDWEFTSNVNVSTFSGFDYVLLGDIHKRQILSSDNPKMAYPGSLIQQDYSEEIEHGLLEWDLIKGTSKFVAIKNDIGYAKFKFKNNILISNEYTNLPKYLKVKVESEDTSEETIADLISKLKSDRHIIKEYTHIKSKSNYNITGSGFKLGNTRNIQYQNDLMESYLIQKGYDSIVINPLKEINSQINLNVVSTQPINRNVKWVPIRYEFSNMFSYGENNVIDFTQLNGLIGLFGPNAVGKSSVLDAMTFTIFDKCSRSFRASDVLNINKDFFKSKLIFEYGGEQYIIIRNGIRNTNNVAVTVEYYKIKNGNIIEDLRGKERDDTNKNIRVNMGTYEDFLLTAFSTQNDNKNFIFKTQKDRKDLLYSFLDLNIFSDLYKYSKEILNKKNAILQKLKLDLTQIDIDAALTQKELYTELYNSNISQRDEYMTTITKINSEIINLNTALEKIPISYRNVEDVQFDINSVNTKLTELINRTTELKDRNTKYDQKYSELLAVVFDKYSDLNQSDIEYKLNNLKSKLHQVDIKLVNHNSKWKLILAAEIDLANHEYDPDCKFCISNKFVKDATILIAGKNEVLGLIDKLRLEKAALTSELEECNAILAYFYEKTAHSVLIKQLQHDKELVDSELTALKAAWHSNKLQLGIYQSEIKLIQQYEKNIIRNAAILNNIEKLKVHLFESTSNLKTINETIIQVNSNIMYYDNIILEYDKLQSEILEYSNDSELYKIYNDVMSSDGISYFLLEKILPVIEEYVNDLLTPFSEFRIKLITDEKYNIICHIIYNDGKSWVIEMASGMEKFIVSIAIRHALLNVTTLARPNFMAIDEGFGTLDSENLSNVSKLFDVLKDNFDFILCVTHLEAFKDNINNMLEINKLNGFSYINNL